MPNSDKEKYGSDIPSNDRYENWTWRQIKAAVTGYSDMNSQAGARANDVSDPESLYSAAEVFLRTQRTLEQVRDTLDLHSKAIAGENGPWRGPAADAFRAGMDSYAKVVQAHVDQLTDQPTGRAPVVTQLVRASNELRRAVWELDSIDEWYAAEAKRAGAGEYDHGERGKLVHISEKPEVVNMMTQDMVRVIKRLAGDYTVTHAALRPPPADPNLDPTRDPKAPEMKALSMSPPPVPAMPPMPSGGGPGTVPPPALGGAGDSAVAPWNSPPGAPRDLGLPGRPEDLGLPPDPATRLQGGLASPAGLGSGGPAITPWPGGGGSAPGALSSPGSVGMPGIPGFPGALPGSRGNGPVRAWPGASGSGAGSGRPVPWPGGGSAGRGLPGMPPIGGEARTWPGGAGAGGARVPGLGGAGGVRPFPGGAAEAEHLLGGRAGGNGLAGTGPAGSAGSGPGRSVTAPAGTAPAGGSAGSGYPYPPPMGGAGAPAAGAQERERTTWLVEDDAVWGASPEDAVPGVIGGRSDSI